VGLRLSAAIESAGGTAWQPYLKANLWYSPTETDRISFDADEIKIRTGTTAVELGGGVVAKLTDQVSLFGTGDYLFDVAGQDKEVIEGNLGLQLKF
jgi:autotransporter family porin